MALRAYYLGDTSAPARASIPAVAERLLPLLEAGLVARCTVTHLEAGFSSNSPADHSAMREARAAWPFVDIDQATLHRAVEVQDQLAARSQHRGAKIATSSLPPQQRPRSSSFSTTTTTSTSSPTSPDSPSNGSSKPARSRDNADGFVVGAG